MRWAAPFGCSAFPLFGSYLAIYLALNRRLPPVPAARFGDLSYGLYIYGWPIEQCVVYFSGGAAPWWEVFGISLALAVPVAWLSWHGIERRCRWRARTPEDRRLALVGEPSYGLPAAAEIPHSPQFRRLP